MVLPCPINKFVYFVLMKNEIFDFIHRGFFPKELPPAFNTYLFAVNYEDIEKEWKVIDNDPSKKVTRLPVETDTDYNNRICIFKNPVSTPVQYSYAKGRISRRALSVLNPVNFLPLAICIDTNIQEIKAFIDQSFISQSKPTYETGIHERCFRASSISVWALTLKKLSLSQGKIYELKLDISLFYPSIYTHSITWAIIGKDRAKQLWRQHGDRKIDQPSSPEEVLYNIGHELDHYVQRCQDKQTHGIPIGPDTSFIIAEILGTYIDQMLSQSFPDLKACRYYDDYSIFVQTKEEAAAIIYRLQSIMGDLGLTINESKIRIEEAPKPFLEDYAEELTSIRIEPAKMAASITKYFNVLWRLCDMHPYKSVSIIKFGLHPLENSNIVIRSANKDLFESLLYKTALIEPAVLNQVCDLITIKGYNPTTSSLTTLVTAIIKKHAHLSHHHEVSWALWIIKKYDLVIDTELIKDVFRMQNSICTLLILDYINNNSSAAQHRSDPDIQSSISSIGSGMTAASLFNEDWILVYEGAFHKWLNTESIIQANPYFNYLYTNKISFYDQSHDADYQSYDYIEQLPVNVYTQEMRKAAKDFKSLVMKDVYDYLFGEIEKDQVLTSQNKDSLKQKYKQIAKFLKIEDEIREKALSEIFRRQIPNHDQYVKDAINRLRLMSCY